MNTSLDYKMPLIVGNTQYSGVRLWISPEIQEFYNLLTDSGLLMLIENQEINIELNDDDRHFHYFLMERQLHLPKGFMYVTFVIEVDSTVDIEPFLDLEYCSVIPKSETTRHRYIKKEYKHVYYSLLKQFRSHESVIPHLPKDLIFEDDKYHPELLLIDKAKNPGNGNRIWVQIPNDAISEFTPLLCSLLSDLL